MTEKPTLYLMVGLPGSGKTTRAKELEQATRAVRFTPDEWHIFLFGDDFGDNSPAARALHGQRHDRVEQLMWTVGQDLLRKGVSVILDFGFWVEEQREEKAPGGPGPGANFAIEYLDTPLPELKTPRRPAQPGKPGRRVRHHHRRGPGGVVRPLPAPHPRRTYEPSLALLDLLGQEPLGSLKNSHFAHAKPRFLQPSSTFPVTP